MPHKVDVTRRCADLIAALARTANVRLSLKETGISAYWAYGRRKADPEFDARWRTAVRAGRRDLARAAGAAARDPQAPRPGAAAKLTIVGSSGKGTLRLERVKPCGFTDAKRAVFIDVLRATCNVRAAARAAGVSARGAYAQYHADAAFRALWEATLGEGRVHLEMALIASARALFEPRPEKPGTQDDPMPDEVSMREAGAGEVGAREAGAVAAPVVITGMDAKVALQLLRLHAPRDPAGRGRGRWVKAADAETTRREILAKVAAVRAAGGGGATARNGQSGEADSALPGECRDPGPSLGLDPGFRRGEASSRRGLVDRPDGGPDAG